MSGRAVIGRGASPVAQDARAGADTAGGGGACRAGGGGSAGKQGLARMCPRTVLRAGPAYRHPPRALDAGRRQLSLRQLLPAAAVRPRAAVRMPATRLAGAAL